MDATVRFLDAHSLVRICFMVSRRVFLVERFSVIALWKGKETELRTRRLILTKFRDVMTTQKQDWVGANLWVSVEMGLKIVHEQHQVGQAVDIEMVDESLGPMVSFFRL
jgi:hypothetical protein